MMGQWTGSGGDAEEGVSAEVAFGVYDKDGSGYIDAKELEYLLEDLGVEISDERLRM
jgi:Ca2+-binding EF-hand superfamily protein